MTNPDDSDPTGRFSDRADHYARYRPGYPPAVLELFRRELGLGPQSVVADVGSGTGILTAMLLGQGCAVHAVEPNPAMRGVAERDLALFEGFHSRDGRAEATGLGPQSVDLVFAAQAFHWFRRTEARPEFARILRPGGSVVLVWNRRLTEGSEFLRAYEDMLRREAVDYALVDHRRATEPAVLTDFFGRSGYRQAIFPNEQTLDRDGLRGRLLSSSYVPGEDHPRHAEVIGEMRRLFERTQEAGVVRIKYDTEVYWVVCMTEHGTAPKREPEDPELHEVVLSDLRHTELRKDYLEGLKQLYQFYLDDDRRARLAGMGRIRRAFSMLGWLFKSLLMKLSPARRLLILAALILAFLAPTTGFDLANIKVSADLRPLGAVLLLVALMLELRDKLLAKDEIAVARQVQLALLPRAHPDVPGWRVWSCSRPANDVGGDLVDYIERDGFRHAVLLGDVAGKGLGAALLTAKLQATLRAILPSVVSLDELGARVNEIFRRDGLDNRYATLFFAELEHHSGHVRYLNAGHNPPFVIRPDRFERLPASSYPLGMLAQASYEEGAVELAPGDLLLAYSDGLTEACNEAGEEFGVGRLERLLPELRSLAPEAIGARLLKEVDGFVGTGKLSDDLSLAVIIRQ